MRFRIAEDDFASRTLLAVVAAKCGLEVPPAGDGDAEGRALGIVVERLFPFHLTFDRTLTLTSAGPSLLKVGGTRLLGRRLPDVLTVRSEGPADTYAALVADEQRLFVAELESHGFVLRGQIIEVEPGCSAIFLARPGD